jgi:hypothetical protein
VAEGRIVIDLLTLVMMHAILALAAWRLLLRPDLDADPATDADKPSETSQSA